MGLLWVFVKLQMLTNAQWSSNSATSTLTVWTSQVDTIAPAELDTPEMDLPAQVCSHHLSVSSCHVLHFYLCQITNCCTLYIPCHKLLPLLLTPSNLFSHSAKHRKMADFDPSCRLTFSNVLVTKPATGIGFAPPWPPSWKIDMTS